MSALPVPGMGPKTVRKLLTRFGSAQTVRLATEEELAALVGPAVARKVVAFRQAAVPE